MGLLTAASRNKINMTHPRYIYAVDYGSLYRFRYQKWIDYLKLRAQYKPTDNINDFADLLGEIHNISDIGPEEAESLLSEGL